MPDTGITLGEPVEGKKKMEDTTKVLTEQSAVRQFELLAQSAVRHNNDANYVSTTTQLQHQLTSQLVGAKAAQNIEQEGLADAIMQHRAATGQPDKSA